MRNLIGFNKFKKIYEEADPGVLEDKEMYFANVKGNFAGAETTLIGSNLIRLFNFFRRKGSQFLLYKFYRTGLDKEYMKGLLRAIIRYNMTLPEPKTIYEATLVRDINQNKVEQKLFLVEIKVIDEGDGNFEQFKVGSEVLTQDGNKLTDGFYMIDNKVLKIVDSKIKEIDFKLKDLEEDVEDVKDVEDEEIKAEKHIIDFIEDIKKKYDRLDQSQKKSFLDKYIKNVEEMINLFKDNIKEIEKIIKNDKEAHTKIEKAHADLPLYQENIKALEGLLKHMEQVDDKPVTKKVDEPVATKPTPVESKPASEVRALIPESLGINEEVDEAEAKRALKRQTKKFKDVDKIGDELNLLSQVDIDLENPDFLKQFDKPEQRKKVTAVILQSKSDIVKLQLGAERFYTSGAAEGKIKIDRKLYNDWQKMVEKVKGKYSRFMDVDAVDPFILKRGLDKATIDKYAEATIPEDTAANSLIDFERATKNSSLKSAISAKTFHQHSTGDFGIIRVDNNPVIYSINYVEIPHGSKKRFPTYKIVASVEYDELLKKAVDDPKKNNFEEFLKRGKLPKTLTPNSPDLTQAGSGLFTFMCTIILSSSSDNLSTGVVKASGYILFVYAKDKSITKITKDNINNFRFMYRDEKEEKDILLRNDFSTHKTDKPKERSRFDITTPAHINNNYISIFGLTDEDRSPNLSEITANEGSTGYTLGEFFKR